MKPKLVLKGLQRLRERGVRFLLGSKLMFLMWIGENLLLLGMVLLAVLPTGIYSIPLDFRRTELQSLSVLVNTTRSYLLRAFIGSWLQYPFQLQY